MLIAPFVDSWMDELCARTRDLAAGQRLHLLIDGAFVPGLHRSIHPDRKIMLFASLPGCSEEALDLSSFLMPFDPEDASARRILQRCSGWPMVSVIRTHEDLGQLAARITAWTVVEADGQRFHLRFADTRRIPAIVQALDPGQRAQLLGPATSWACVARSGAWQEIRLDGADAEVAAFPVLDARQFAMLVEDSLIDEMQALFMRRHPGPFIPAWQGYEVLTLALQVAEKARLKEPALLDWCEFLWREGQIETPTTAADNFANWQATQVDRA
ncbi:DUF4123 domain-containing protein [Massilia arenae]|uniref:DUF4123 domain-containing protein n=1 Tax=Massilia arenae TaxID=2603288 RepID=A0A5C7G7P2_9BURK|nr:DUF4123 domain-containing protein [Massilia arenae]TXG02050.1 DUF4123 domain-containing protein [Massilia arenae]